ncbi:MAG: xylulokinase [Ruthenibacterium sp.]
MNYLLGIDLGTSGTKTVLFDTKGKAVASATAEYPLYQSQNGWAEQDTDDWWNAVVQTISCALKQSRVPATDIKGIGISGQMHGLVLLDANGDVLRKSILWCDGRTQAECDEITATIGKERLIQITANPALPGFTASKILWVRKHEPEIWEKTAHILLPKDYVRYKLTGVFATEVSDASGMNLLDITKRQWSDEILEKLQIDKALLPKMHESIDVTGGVTAHAAMLTGLAQNTPVVGGAGDNAAAAIGIGVVENGKAFTTIGTSGVVFAHSDTVQIDTVGRVHTFCAAVPGAYTVMSCTLAAGLSLKWFRDNFCAEEIAAAKEQGTDPYVIMDKEAEKISIGADRLLFLPYLMGERSPILDSDARGVFFGLSAMHTKAHLLRAVLEGVVYSQRECLDVLREMHVAPKEMLACGGGGTSPLWRQMLADVFNLPVKTMQSKEGPALGVAILAGVGVGIYSSVAQACKQVIVENSPQTPIVERIERYEQFFELYKTLYPTLKNDFAELAKL